MAAVLAGEGCDVAVTYRRSRAGAEAAAEAVGAHGRRGWVVPLDLSTPGQAAGDAAALVDTVGGLDVRVLCAGHHVVIPAAAITATEWDYAQKSLLLQRYATSRRVAELIAVVASPVGST